MLILPAIDLLDGAAVRLKQGKEETKKVYSNDPPAMARRWRDMGAEYIHLVNLDGAFGRAQKNIDAIKNIVDAVDIPVELGGGIRSLDDVQRWLAVGVERVIIGTIALTEPEIVDKAVSKFGPDRIVVGIDGRNGKVAIRGWEEQTDAGVLELALHMRDLGVRRIIYTDVHRDGELIGPNFDGTDELATKANMKVIASGGFSAVEHFEKLQALQNPNIEGAIVGTAIYEGKIDLRQLLQKLSLHQF